jgi:hypothetical protein
MNQLQRKCAVRRHVKTDSWVLMAVVLFAAIAGASHTSAQAAEINLYVSPTGADNNAGTSNAPLATLEAARDKLRALRSDGRLANGQTTVWLCGGDYFLHKPFDLTAQDSGSARSPVTYRAVDGQLPALTNSRQLSPSDFHLVTDPQTLARLAPTARGKVLELNLKQVGAKHISPFSDVMSDTGNIVDLFVDNQRMSLSRSPDGGVLTIKRVLVNSGGPAAPASNDSPQWSEKPTRLVGGTFEYRDEAAPLIKQWSQELQRGLWLKGYWRVMWQNEAIRVAAIDLQNHTVTFAKPVAGGIGSKYHRPAGDGKEQYWAINLPEGIDRPGQWCLDFADQKLFLYPPPGFDKANIRVADADEPVIRLRGAANVVLRGISVEDAMADGIDVEGGHDDLIAGCIVRDVDKYAIVINGGLHHTVQSCDLYHLGCGGVWLSGGDEKSNPRKPAGHRVINNHIHHFSELVKVYTPAVNCGYVGGNGAGHHPAVGMYVAHNLIHDTPHGGILYGSWDSVFEYNEIFRYCLVSNDLGAFYSYDSYDLDGNQTFRYNLVHGTLQGDGFYWDNDHRDMHVYGNIVFLQSENQTRGIGFLYKIGTQAQHPQSIECYNNIAIGCKTGFNWVSARPAQGKIENNVAVDCKTPFNWQVVSDGKSKKSPPFPTGKNVAYAADPGFVDMAHLNFQIKPGSQLLQNLPGFEPIPVEQIGLQIDEYRRTLPTDKEIARYSLHSDNAGAYDIEDR